MKDDEYSTDKLIPLARLLIHKLKDDQKLDESTALSVEDALEELILKDPDVSGKINELAQNIRSTRMDSEKTSIPIWRALVRPLVTIFLTLFFVIFLFIWLFAPIWFDDPAKVVAHLKEMLPVFLGIYGSIIGFWFGEHTAERAQEKQAQAQIDVERAKANG
ncbi:hypothetical protein [Neptunomonas qingdaonensis]|uniref:Holin of 3TMs, for gene-transfer release n=1 Tax=Neptunomonas qingdaonensis TaxID=1045558 RepID=A0A1I2URQ0_9GAMM|nr:hypothetical protein [Neptunomonas qingdaonensis]SFG79680.1 hypothetical protein SAMN05216175_1144 [Neptunomonas qingdaonensis]